VSGGVEEWIGMESGEDIPKIKNKQLQKKKQKY
jgi:hypothetical protein